MRARARAPDGGRMKRDMDVIRRILLELEGLEHSYTHWVLPLEGVDDDIAAYNAALLVNAGLVEGSITRFMAAKPPHVLLLRLTWAGHDFLDAAREPGRWERVKGMAAAAGGVTFDVLKAWLVEAIPSPFGRA